MKQFNRKRKTVSILGAAAISLWLIANAEAATIYDNGTSAWDGAAVMETYVVAEDFSLDTAATATGATLDVWWASTAFSISNVDWWIFENSAGNPGSIISSGDAQNISSTHVGTPSNGNTEFWRMSFDFGQSISLDANTTYWLGVHSPDDYLSWSITYPPLVGYTVARSAGGIVSWSHDSNPDRGLAFTLEGTVVPEPTSTLLMLSGLLALLGSRGRRQ